MNYLVEACSNSIQSAINAELAGANRIELCENLMLGGTTPSVGCIKNTRKRIKVPINVLVRPRSDDFLYSDLEFEQIKDDISAIKKLDIQGIVCGILLPNGRVDIDRTKELVELAKPLTFTFHRAFDFTPNAFDALEDVIAAGATHILTSGQKNKACNSVEMLTKLVEKAGSRIQIIVGSGINKTTIKGLIGTRAKEFHLSGIADQESKMIYRPHGITLNGTMPAEYTTQTSKIENIKSVINLLCTL